MRGCVWVRCACGYWPFVQVGALEPTRLARFRARRDTFEDPTGEIPPFLYVVACVSAVGM